MSIKSIVKVHGQFKCMALTKNEISNITTRSCLSVDFLNWIAQDYIRFFYLICTSNSMEKGVRRRRKIINRRIA